MASIFDEFWDELPSYLDEITLAVDERRHVDVMHAVSIWHLLELITERLKSKHPDSTVAIPSQEWVRLQFSSQQTRTLNEQFATLDDSKSSLEFRYDNYTWIILILTT